MAAQFAMSLPSAVAFIAAGILAYRSQEGWGWFLFVGMLCAGSMKVVAQ
ncbi:hypothetical protein LB517_28280 [Mesorhizobium sp. BR1-1-12]|nr:hypothetical protein [Mesorhizobium sp. BR1-1-12]MBZ9973532.1 hypothetical protein [Mesorhizobium sp. BR1-1-12]